MKIGLIGAGKMGLALARGIVETQPQFSICMSDPASESRERFKEEIPDGEVLLDNQAVCQQADVVFLACKPQQLGLAIPQQLHDDGCPLYISILAGTPLGKIASTVGTDRVVRVMPNTACLIGKGVVGITYHDSLVAADRVLSKSLLENFGSVVEVEEHLMDAVTGVSGSGPAYVFQFVESLIQGGVNAGLQTEVARHLVVETVIGAAEMLKITGCGPAELREQVSSPGGTTVAGLAILNDHDFNRILEMAVGAAVKRSRELAGLT